MRDVEGSAEAPLLHSHSGRFTNRNRVFYLLMVVKAILGVGLAVFAIILLVRWSDVKDAVERWLAHIQKGSLPEALGGYWLIYVTTLLLLLPVEMLNFFGGFLFSHAAEINPTVGVILAVTLSYSALVTAGLMYFWLSRFVFQSFVTEFGKQFDIFTATLMAIERDGVWFVFLLRLSPLSPFSLSNLILGVAPLTTRQWLASSLGCLPLTTLMILLGSQVQLTEANHKTYWSYLVVLGLITNLGLAAYITIRVRDALSTVHTRGKGYQGIGHEQQEMEHEQLKEVVIVAGIYVFFLSFGLFQEKIFNQRDPATGQKFDSPCFVVLLISVGNVLLALAIYAWRKMTGRALYNNEIKPLIQDGTWRQIALCSLTSSLSMVCTNASLSHVSYPTQVLGKSAKLVPVILGSVIVYGQQFPWYDWAGVGLVTTGLIGFNWGGKNKPALDTANPLLGWLLLGLSLLGDALTGPRQDAIMRKRHLDSVQFMLIQNTFTALNSLVLTLLLEGSAPLKFVSSNIDLAPSFLGLTLAGGLGQTFIYAALISFGSLYLSLITTTRKFFTVFASVFYFSHQLSSLQWLSVAVIFFALGLQSAMKHLSKRKM